MFKINLDEVIKEVRECDRKIIAWLKENGVLKKDDYCLVFRPDLVKVRLKILNKLGIVDIDEEGNVTLIREPPDVEMLPVNSDRIEFRIRKLYMVYLIYSIIRDYRPTGSREIVSIFNRIVGTDHTPSLIYRYVYELVKSGIVRRIGNRVNCRYEPAVNILTEDYEYYIKQYMEDDDNARFIERAKAKRGD